MTKKELVNQFCEYRGKCTTDDVVALSYAYETLINPHWVSVEDKLPIDYEPVLAVVGGNHFAFVGICLNQTTWYCDIQNKAVEIKGITHWCHLPQPPVLSNSENTGKDLKGDDNG